MFQALKHHRPNILGPIITTDHIYSPFSTTDQMSQAWNICSVVVCGNKDAIDLVCGGLW